MIKIRTIFIEVFILIMLLLNGCVSAFYTEKAETKSQEDTYSSESEILNMPDIYYADSINEAKTVIESAFKHSELNYQWICRDNIVINGTNKSCIWIYAVNDYHEWVDIILMEETMDSVYKMLYTAEGISPDNPGIMRKNEAASYQHKFQAAHWDTGLGETAINENYNHSFTYCITGNHFAMNDCGACIDSAVGERQLSHHSRDPKTAINSMETRGSDFQEYYPDSDIQNEIHMIQERLKESGLDYTWEINNTISIHGIDYPVVWMYAKNRDGEWFDVVFSKDPDFCYFLYQNRKLFSILRDDEIQTMNTKHPGRGEAEVSSSGWIVQDVFYYGYSFYMEGYPLAMFDSGMVSDFIEWNDVLQKYTLYNSRDIIWYINYYPDYENYK